ncbi:hypothetical protein NDU88_003547 [Pleurodeles waltl]|uniref:Uncharacterized protein n=1 Tax=Pleurodeles waltl TaxID=8319 RepID=A0AAV7V2R9_PLEWA|nr:hypothetical protein NDU88_003547 [Pleurodeles waltl]
MLGSCVYRKRRCSPKPLQGCETRPFGRLPDPSCQRYNSNQQQGDAGWSGPGAAVILGFAEKWREERRGKTQDRQ